MNGVDDAAEGLPLVEDAPSVQRAILDMGAEPELHVEVVKVFFEEVGGWRRQLQEALDARAADHSATARERVIACMHEAAGGLCMAGAARAGRHVRQIEFSLRESDSADLEQAVRGALCGLDAGTAALEQWCNLVQAGSGLGQKPRSPEGG